MDSLTKENFWNALQEKYPAGMKIFSDWIDEYKKQNKWNQLFQEQQTIVFGFNCSINDIPKYHDIPYAMIVGIFMQFESEMSIKHQPFYFFKARKHIEDFIKDLNQESTD